MVMAQHTQPSPNTSADGRAAAVLVIGIDPGTTGAKVAFLRAFEAYDGDKIELIVNPYDRVHVLANFPGYRQSYMTTFPTCLVYNESRDLTYWGHQAVNIQAKSSFDRRFLVENWKIKLLEGSMQSPLGKHPQDFTTDFFRALINFLFYGERSPLLGHFGGSDGMAQFDFFDIAVAIPPGWGHEEHTLFTDAAKKALQGIPKVRISMVSETECALRSWQFQEGKYGKIVRRENPFTVMCPNLPQKDGEVVILMDLGGGTACLSSFLYEGERWAHLESYSLRAGSEVATAAFQRDFTARLKTARIPETNKIFRHALKQFTERKMEIGTDNEEDIWLCPVEGLKHSEQHAFRDGEMLFTREELWSYFQPLQEDILGKLDDMVARTRPKHCVLVGAYSRNDLFLNLLEKENQRYGMKIVTPENQAEVVASGACYTRVEGDIRLVDRSKISVGIVTFRLWNAVKLKDPAAYHFRLPGDSRWYCRVITWVLKKGDRADPSIAIIDFDGTDLRRRYLQSSKDLIINEVILTIEADPGQDEPYTVLQYGTDDAGWEQNKLELNRKLGGSIQIRSFELNLTHTPVQNEDGSKVAMKKADFKRDTISRYFEYKYYLNLSQTDCRMSLQAFSRTGQTGKMLLQYSISAYEVESKELREEQRFAEQFSQTQKNGMTSKKRRARCHTSSPKRRSRRVKAKNQKSLSSMQISRVIPGDDRESLHEDEISIATTAGNCNHHSQPSNISSPAINNDEVMAFADELLQSDLLDQDINLSYSENENWNIAKDALNWLEQPNEGNVSPSAPGSYLTFIPGLTVTAASTGSSTSNPNYIKPASSYPGDESVFEDLEAPPEDENDPDYDPREKHLKKLSTPYSKQAGSRPKRIRTK